MEILFPAMALITFLAILAFSIVHSKRAAEQRRQSLQGLAEAMQLEFLDELPDEDANLFSQFKLANQGRDRKSLNVIVADSGMLRLTIFDYAYTVGGGKNKSTPHQTVALASASDLDLPQFTLAPENFFHRIADWFGYKDIDFENDPNFSDKFLLHGESVESVREFFTAQRRAAFVQLEHVQVEGRGANFIFYRPGQRKNADEMKSLIEEAFAVYTALAESV